VLGQAQALELGQAQALVRVLGQAQALELGQAPGLGRHNLLLLSRPTVPPPSPT